MTPHRTMAIVAVALLALAAYGAHGTVADGAPDAQSSAIAASETPPCTDPFHALFARAAPAIVRVARGRQHCSGVIVSADGMIVTHRHLITRNTMDVYLSDGRKLQARMRLRDSDTELAILQIIDDAADSDAPDDSAARSLDWPVAPLGPAEPLRAGDWVGTLAYPFGSDSKRRSTPSLSAGVLSARGRIEGIGLDYEGELLLTDAAMNLGSEGGALLGSCGNVAGILCQPQFHKDTGTALNVALPVEVIDDLIERARTDPDPPIAVETGAPRTHGFLGVQGATAAGRCVIQRVVPGQAAQQAGLKSGDIITSVDDKTVAGWDDLVAILRETSPGEEIVLTVERDGETLKRTVTLGRFPERLPAP